MTRTSITLEEAIKTFDRVEAQRLSTLAEKERNDIVQKFPLDQWESLPLNRYALGLGNRHDSFCWWLEFGSSHIGSVRGGNASKHVIFKQSDGNWFFDRNRFRDQEEAWATLRSDFVNALAKATNGEWDWIESEELGWGPAMGAKTLYCYFPDQLLPVFSLSHIVHFLKLLRNAEATTSGYRVVRQNRLLRDALRSKDSLKGWSNDELARFLYFWADPRDQPRFVKIAPGEEAKYWDQCLQGEYICVGWDKVGDLRQFDSKEAFQQRFNDEYKDRHNKTKLSQKSKELWTLRELEPGDTVVANKGISKILAIGKVEEPVYEWNEERNDYRHIVKVKWDTSFEQDIPPQAKWAFQTVANIPTDLVAKILAKSQGGKLPPVPIERRYLELDDAITRKGQVILYGPPGTGKTYTARRFAVWWLQKQLGIEAAEVLINPVAFSRAEQKLSTARVVQRSWWMVANPKEWSWDRLFKEKRVTYRYGRLQRNYPLVRPGDLVVGYQSTPDKKLMALARISREMFTDGNGNPAIDLEPLAMITDGLSYDELQSDDILRNSEPMRFRNQGTLFALTEDEFDHLAVLLSERDPNVRTHLEVGNGVGPLTNLTFHPSYSYEDFIEGYRPADSVGGSLSLKLEDGIFKRICRAAQANPKQAYLVLVDEINRANIAKVFGELITLLEYDKRGMLISLPQSKEAFMIPRNVYVLGTMNTADKSIKLLDAALRRRFAFIELMPDSTLLEGGKVGTLDLVEFLEGLNKRIAAKEGREKQIGHSFLIDDGQPVTELEEFARRFRQEILPLLQEYCYDDYRVLAEYIGNELVDIEGQLLDEERLNNPEQLVAALEKFFTAEPAT